MTRECELLVRVRAKPDLNLVFRCSLTGHECLCEFYPLNCTRRTWALSYLAKHPAPQQGIPIPEIQD